MVLLFVRGVMNLGREFNAEKELEEIRIKLIDPIVAEQISQVHDSPFKTKQQQFQELEQCYLDSARKSIDLYQETSKKILEDPQIGIQFPKDSQKHAEEYKAAMLSFQKALNSNKSSPEMPAPLQERLKIPAESMEKIYKKCLALYEEKNFEKASSCCLFAINLNPLYSNFWSMLAICLEHLEQFGGASQAYMMAGTLDPSNWKMHVGAVRTLIKWDKRAEAEQYATNILETLEQNNETQAIQSFKACLKVLIK
jgi:tetratricopeptide (TPR) repeat protein